MSVYIKPVNPTDRIGTVLYLPGATWHNYSMFDLPSDEASMADILQQRGIETYSINWEGIDRQPAPAQVGNAHDRNLARVIELIEQNPIDYILAYSYGVAVALDLVRALPGKIRGIMLLDPYPALKPPGTPDDSVLTDGGDKKIVSRNQVQADLIKFASTVEPAVGQAYIENLTDPDKELTVAVYPSMVLKERWAKLPNQIKSLLDLPIASHVYFTKTSKAIVRDYFPADRQTMFATASHWILIEPERYQLADSIEQFIKG
jgi:hypothetical protein